MAANIHKAPVPGSGGRPERTNPSPQGGNANLTWFKGSETGIFFKFAIRWLTTLND